MINSPETDASLLSLPFTGGPRGATVTDAKDVNLGTDECHAAKNAASLSNPASSPTSTPVVASAPTECPFPESDTPPRLDPCSFNKCASGHIWPAVLAIAKCPGCAGAVIAVQKVNCPFCNEPIVETNLRSDFVPRGAGMAARCAGQLPTGDSLDIQLQRTAWREVEATTKDFLTREAEERSRK